MLLHGKYRRLMGRLDIRSKSPSAIAMCARSQIAGGLTQVTVASALILALAQSLHLIALLSWAAAIWLVSLYRIVTARGLLPQTTDRAAVGCWQRSNLWNFLLTGLLWGVLPWLPRDGASVMVVSLIYLVPTGISAAASHNLGAMPMALLALVGPIATSHALFALSIFDGPTAAVMAFFSLLYILVMWVGVLMVNNTLLSEWRLVRRNRGIARRSKAQAAALTQTRAELLAANERLSRLAALDPLTGLANRRQFQERLRQDLAQHRRYGAAGVLVVLDLDYFKQVNDTYGHATGDLVLMEAAERMATSLRPSDLAARVGGEEFAVLLPDSDIGTGVTVAERLRATLADLVVFAPDGRPVRITASIGVAAWQHDDRDERDLLERADQALYAAKHAGRDNIRIAVPGLSVVRG
ncbi:diguanylate cyclase [Niveispirillum sp. SYP-B3756]|nr:diguanylate cyclase [Niveispirillum sp. SYP-B3756]